MKFKRIKNGHYTCNYENYDVEIKRHNLCKGGCEWIGEIIWQTESDGQEVSAFIKLDGSKTLKAEKELCILMIDDREGSHEYFKKYPNIKNKKAPLPQMDFKNISYEEVEALFVAPEYKFIMSPFRIKRVQKGRDRYYCTLTEENPTFYLSVTSFSSKALSNPHLANWRGSLGNEEADAKSKAAADYGTFMHIQIGDFIRNGKYNFDALDDIVCEYIVCERLNTSVIPEWIDKAHNDILSFAQFCIDKELEPIAIEFPIVSDTWKLGGVLDLVCKCNYKRNRVTAIIDFKSGRKGFYESHELQLKTYKEIWNETFGDIMPVTHIFNWAPNGWRCSPTYKFKHQGDGVIAHDLLMKRALVEGWASDPKPLKRGMGIVQLGQESIEDNVSIIQLSDFIKSKNIKNANQKNKKA